MKAYKLELDKDEKKKLGFRHNPDLRTDVYMFPVYKYKNKPVLYAQLWTNDDNIINTCVINNDGEIYSPYINRSCGRNDVVKKIDRKIKAEIKELGGREIGQNILCKSKRRRNNTNKK